MDELPRCEACARTPLVGEGITVIAGDRGEVIVCDLCRAKPRAAALGDPVRRDRIRTAAGAANVHRIFPRPVIPARSRIGNGERRTGVV
jgi:hypothetical protein